MPKVTVVFLRPCECGNDDYGSPTRDWPENRFGKFTMIERCMETLTISLPWEDEAE